ncbi:MAG: hypothetical protein HY895_03155 [Deltaproteobacteria bacterium]|nr:hypothetical protein [Deltaproteobacteria bacterium]
MTAMLRAAVEDFPAHETFPPLKKHETIPPLKKGARGIFMAILRMAVVAAALMGSGCFIDSLWSDHDDQPQQVYRAPELNPPVANR